MYLRDPINTRPQVAVCERGRRVLQHRRDLGTAPREHVRDSP